MPGRPWPTFHSDKERVQISPIPLACAPTPRRPVVAHPGSNRLNHGQGDIILLAVAIPKAVHERLDYGRFSRGSSQRAISTKPPPVSHVPGPRGLPTSGWSNRM